MTEELKERAEARLQSALAAPGAPSDPRPLYRAALRYLRDREPATFARAIAYFEETLVPAVAGGSDPLPAWVDYGLFLASAMGGGRTVEVDEGGRARGLDDVTGAAGLVLHLPDVADAPVLVLRHPEPLSTAQRATMELLVAGRVTASAYD